MPSGCSSPRRPLRNLFTAKKSEKFGRLLGFARPYPAREILDFLHASILLQIFQYLTTRKINFAYDNTNQLPIYQQNILHSQISNWSESEKLILAREIEAKNHQLKQIKSIVNQQKKIFNWPILICLRKYFSARELFNLLRGF